MGDVFIGVGDRGHFWLLLFCGDINSLIMFEKSIDSCFVDFFEHHFFPRQGLHLGFSDVSSFAHQKSAAEGDAQPIKLL